MIENLDFNNLDEDMVVYVVFGSLFLFYYLPNLLRNLWHTRITSKDVEEIIATYGPSGGGGFPKKGEVFDRFGESHPIITYYRVK